MKVIKGYRKRTVVSIPSSRASVNTCKNVSFYRAKIAYLESIKRELAEDNYLMLGNISRLQGRNGILSFYIRRRLE
jgi:hypothetical protein